MKFLFSQALTLSLCSGLASSAQAPSAISGHDSRASVSAYVDRRLSGKDPGASKAIFIAGDFNTGRGQKRNPSLWCADLDGTPLIYTDQEKWACVGECVNGAGPNIMLRPATVVGRTAWTTAGPARIGDSGCPVFLPLHGRAVLVCHFFFANGGPSTGYYAAAINAVTGNDYQTSGKSLVRGGRIGE